MYLETVSALRRPVLLPHIEAEERLISSACSLMVASSRLFQIHEERFVLRRPRVRIARGGGEEIRQRSFMSLRRRVAPVNREADMPDTFAVDVHRRQAIGDHRRAFD